MHNPVDNHANLSISDAFFLIAQRLGNKELLNNIKTLRFISYKYNDLYSKNNQLSTGKKKLKGRDGTGDVDSPRKDCPFILFMLDTSYSICRSQSSPVGVHTMVSYGNDSGKTGRGAKNRKTPLCDEVKIKTKSLPR